MVNCEFCGKEAKNKKGLASHRMFSKECFNKWKEKIEKEEAKKEKVECRMCGVKLRNISNTHLRKHNITQQQYKTLFPDAPIFSKSLLKMQNERREKTIKERYTDEEIKYLRGKKGQAIQE